MTLDRTAVCRDRTHTAYDAALPVVVAYLDARDADRHCDATALFVPSGVAVSDRMWRTLGARSLRARFSDVRALFRARPRWLR